MAVNLGTIFSTLDGDMRPLQRVIAQAKAELKKLSSKPTTVRIGGTSPKKFFEDGAKAQKSALSAEKAALSGLTSERKVQRKILSDQLQLDAARQTLLTGETGTLKRKLTDLNSQASIKQKLLDFDRQTASMEVAKLQGIKGVTAADKARLAGQLSSKKFLMEELGLQQQLLKTKNAIAVQDLKARAKKPGLIQRGIQAVTGRVGAGMGGVGGELAGFVGLGGLSGATLAITAGTAAVAALGAGAVAASEKVRILKLSLEAAAGGTKEGAQAFEFARQISNQFGLSLLQTAASYKNVLAATLAGGASAESAQFVFEGLAVGIRALGLEAEPAKRIMVAVGQIMSKGKIQAEELRQQLGEHLPVAMGFLAQGLGVSTAELNKMMEQGKLTSEGMIDLAAQFQKSMGGKVQEQANSLGAQFQRLKNSAFELLASLGQGGLTDAAKSVVAALRSLLEVARVLMPVIKGFFGVIAGGIMGIATFIRVISGVAVAIASMVKAAANLAMGFGPVKFAVDIVIAAFEKLKAIGSSVFGFLGNVIGKITGVAGSLIPEPLKNIFSAGKEGFKQGFFGEEVEAFKQKSDAELDKLKNSLKSTFPKRDEKLSDKKKKEAGRTALNEAKAITRERAAEKSLLQQNLELASIKREIADGERDTVGEIVGNLEAQRAAKMQMIQFDRETLNLEIQKLQSVKTASASQMANIQGQIASKQIKLEELSLTEKIVQAEFQLSAQKERQAMAMQELQNASQFVLEAARQQNQIELEKLKQQGFSGRDLEDRALQGEKALLDTQMQQLQNKLKLAEAQNMNTLEIEREIALLQQSQELLQQEALTFSMEPMLNQAREFANILTTGLQDFIQGMTSGSLNLGELFTGIGEDLFSTSLQPLFNEIQSKLQQTFSGIGSTLGGLGGTLFSGVMIGIGTLFNRQKAETQSLADEVKGNIEQTETVRGLIAGDSSIAVQKLSENLSEAFRPTNDILRMIDSHIIQLIGVFGEAVVDTNYRNADMISLNVLGAPRI